MSGGGSTETILPNAQYQADDSYFRLGSSFLDDGYGAKHTVLNPYKEAPAYTTEVKVEGNQAYIVAGNQKVEFTKNASGLYEMKTYVKKNGNWTVFFDSDEPLIQGESFDSNPLGILLSLAAAVCWGGYSVCLEWAQASSGLSELQSTRKIFFWGLLFTLPFLWGGGLAPDLTRFAQPTLLGNTLYLGIGASALCFLAWNKASALIGPVATNVYLYLMPVITVAASALILAGLALSQRKAPPESP